VRRITRNVTLVILAVVVLLLALGALPSYLKSGDPYYVVATATDEPGPSVEAANLSERSYRYSLGAVGAAAGNGTGRSDPYWRGPVGLKEPFTHSPFDEFGAFGVGYPNATTTAGNDTTVFVSRNDTRYRLVITQTPGSVDDGAGADATNASDRLARPATPGPVAAEVA
jgi:hypothetical protein